MECCENQNIACKNYENVCINCGVIFDCEFVHENIFRDYNMHISNMLQYKKRFIVGKSIYINYAHMLKKLIMTFYYFLTIPWKILGNYLNSKGFLYQNI